MSITIESTSDTKEQVLSAIGGKDEPVVEQSEADEKPAETDDDSEPSEEIDAKEENQENEEGKKRKGGFQKKIDKLTRERHESKAEIERLKAELEGRTKKADPIVIKTNDKPDAAKFESHEEYLEAIADWRIEKRWAEKEQKTKEVEFLKEHTAKTDTFKAKIETFKEAHDDFDDAIADVNDIVMPSNMQDAIFHSENAPELMYALAKNREELKRICSLSPALAVKELGKFEAKFLDSEKEVTKKTTKAPPPIKPVGTKASAGNKALEDMDYREFKKARELQIQKGY
jgi:hypothetical protein